jgi:pyruvate kinase
VAIVVFTATGTSARLVARYRPPVPVFAFTSNAATARQLSVIFGLRAVVTTHYASTDDMMDQMNRALIEEKMVRPGDSVVFIAGQPIGIPGTTNMVKLHRIS